VSDKLKLDPMKREAGGSPARSRRCNKGIVYQENEYHVFCH